MPNHLNSFMTFYAKGIFYPFVYSHLISLIKYELRKMGMALGVNTVLMVWRLPKFVFLCGYFGSRIFYSYRKKIIKSETKKSGKGDVYEIST